MKWLSFFIFLLCCQTVKSQVRDTVVWRKEYKLVWTDFKAKEPGLKTYPVAESHIDYGIDVIKVSGNVLQISVYPVFHRDKSFKDNFEVLYFDSLSIQNARKNILEHEQLHFDIAELVCRRVRKEIIDSLSVIDCNNLQAFRSDWYNRIVGISRKIQKKYDKEALFNGTEQVNWNKWVAEELDKMNSYSGNIQIKCAK